MEEHTTKTDRELLILIYERQKVMFHNFLKIETRVATYGAEIETLKNWKARLGGVWLAILIASGVVSAVATLVIELVK